MTTPAAGTAKIVSPTIDEINTDITNMINERVVAHLEKVLKQLAKDHFINYEQLNDQYLKPIKLVAHDLKGDDDNDNDNGEGDGETDEQKNEEAPIAKANDG